MTLIPRRVVSTVAENIVLPIAAYLVLTAIGWQPVWALVGAAATSVAVLAVGFARTRELTTLGLLVLLRFALDIAVAAITGDPQLQLAKDFAITGVIGVVAATSLTWRRPLIARIRRDLAGRPDAFEQSWRQDGSFRSLHRRLTATWAVALSGEAVTGILLVYTLPLTAAVIVTSILSPSTLVSLIAWTEYRARRQTVRASTPTLAGVPDHRAHFDFDIRFANGGDLVGTAFRLDLPHPDLDEPAIGRLLVAHLGLALVDTVELRGLRIVEEAHRGSRGVAPASTSAGERVIDLSHPIRAGLITYPGLPAPVITPHLTRADSRSTYAPGTEFAMDVITMIGNTGTYLDSPFHRYADGKDLAGLDLSTLVGLRAEVFHLSDAWDADRRGIRAETLADREVRGAAVLLHTGWDEHFGTAAYGVGAPFLTANGARYLIDAGATLVGIDSVNLDDTESGGERPAHTLLLGAGVHVVEHLTNLGDLPPRGARFTAVPPAVEGFGTFPVRAFAEVLGP